MKEVKITIGETRCSAQDIIGSDCSDASHCQGNKVQIQKCTGLIDCTWAMMTNAIESASDVDYESGYYTDTTDDGIIGDVGGESGRDVNGVAGDDGSSGGTRLDVGLCVGD